VISRSLAIAAIAALATTAVVGDANAQAREQIRIVGSSTVYPFSTLVAETFGRTTNYPTPVVESTGSGGGLKLFCAGIGPSHPDFTNASRAIKDSERELCASNGVTEITQVQIGFDGIVIGHDKGAAEASLTRAELFQALAARVEVDGEVVENPYTMWSEIDPSLPAYEIKVLGPPPTSGTRDAFVELAMEEGCEEFEAIKALPEDEMEQVCGQIREDGAYIEAGENDTLIVNKLVADPEAFGIFGFSFLDQNRDRIKGASVEGTEPTFDNIASGAYPLSRPLYFYVKNAHVGVIPGMREYLAEFTSERAWGDNGYLKSKGLIPLDRPVRHRMRTEALNLVNNVFK